MTVVIIHEYVSCLCHCSGGHIDIVTWLVTTGHVDVNSVDDYGQTPLHKACE